MSDMSDAVPEPPPPPPEPPAPYSPPTGASSYPVTLELTSELDVARWRPLVHWLLVIPQWFVLYILEIASGFLWFISFFAVLFTERNPFVGFQTMVLRYMWRVSSYALFMREPYPPFEFDTVAADPGPDTALVSVQDPGAMNRWLVLVKWILAIPHYVVLFFLGIASGVAVLIAIFVVLFTGAWPQGLRDFVVGVVRWSTRVNAYVLFLTDEYPPFSLQ